MTKPHLSRRHMLASTAAASFAGIAAPSLAAVLGYPRAMEGPMVGAPGPGHLTIWTRASGAFEVTLEVCKRRDFSGAVVTTKGQASKDGDFCVVLRAEGLEPDTAYYYRLRYAGDLDRHQPIPHRAKTAPAGAAEFRVAFGSCCRLQFDPEQRIFTTVKALEPDLFFWLGDNIYADSDQPENIADLYRRGRAVEALQPLLRSTPQLAIWDDHDFGFNDSDGANPIKVQSLGLFKNYWANPSYGEPGKPGVYFKQAYGGVDFFFLDGRYYRDATSKPEGRGKTMLGPDQKAWLKRELKASQTPFKVLVSGGGWSSAEKDAGGDSWGAYMTERDEIFDFIRDEAIGGVVCISGDSHMGELNCVPRSNAGGYDIYDFCSSPLAQMPAVRFLRQEPEVRVRDVWTRSVNVGVMSFRMGADPVLTYTLHDVLGEAVWAPLVLRPADLKNGVRTWDKLSDPGELKRLKRREAGRGYYGTDPT